MLKRMEAQEREGLEAAFLEEARGQFRRMFDRGEEKVQRTFAELDDQACAAGDALTRFLLERRVQGEEKARAVEVYACPDCGRPTLALEEDGTPVEREVVARRGAVRFARPERACRACRRALFPPRPGPASGGGGL